jgi:tetratricopeptide (TPR) repeat protein
MWQVILGIVMACAVATHAQAQGGAVRPFEADAFDFRRLDNLYAYGSPECTRNRSEVSDERAIEACTRVIEDDRRTVAIGAALLVRANRYDDVRDEASALADFERAAALYTEELAEQPHSAPLFSSRSDAYYGLGRFDEALADLDRALLIDTGFAAGYFRRAMLHFMLGNYTAAMADYDRTARLGERMAGRGSMHRNGHADRPYLNPAITAGRCEARAAAGVELNAARNFCRDAMRVSSARYAFSRGFLLFKQGDFEGAWADFNTTAQNDEDDGYAIYARGVAAIRLGRQAEGEADIARGRELEGEDLAFYANAGLTP